MDITEYIDIPFLDNGKDRNGLDCWRLVVMFYREKLGIDLPDFSGIYVDGTLASLKKVTRIIRENKKKWQQVKKPQPYDVILIRTGSMVYHAGIVVGRRTMLHIMEGVNSTVEEFTGLMWKDKVEGFYRYRRAHKTKHTATLPRM